MKKVLVIGGSGFLGSHVSDCLSRNGFKVTIYDIKKSRWLRKDQKMIIGNISNDKRLEQAIKGNSFVYNFAAISDIDFASERPRETVEVNILGTARILEKCLKLKVKRFVHASTIYVNSIDGGFYRSSKKAAEDYIEEYQKKFNLNFTILRFGSLYGERADHNNGIRKILASAVLKKRIVYNGSIKSIRQYIHVSDAAKACVKILNDKYKNKHITLTGLKKIKLRYFLNKLKKGLNIKNKVIFLNKKKTGHYVITPYTYKPNIGIKYQFKNVKNFYEEIFKLTQDMKI
tara:strand:+ start:40 stop:903 length:864 start_codon:yes stop_codon:yes gene_type:complete